MSMFMQAQGIDFTEYIKPLSSGGLTIFEATLKSNQKFFISWVFQFVGFDTWEHAPAGSLETVASTGSGAVLEYITEQWKVPDSAWAGGPLLSACKHGNKHALPFLMPKGYGDFSVQELGVAAASSGDLDTMHAVLDEHFAFLEESCVKLLNAAKGQDMVALLLETFDFEEPALVDPRFAKEACQHGDARVLELLHKHKACRLAGVDAETIFNWTLKLGIEDQKKVLIVVRNVLREAPEPLVSPVAPVAPASPSKKKKNKKKKKKSKAKNSTSQATPPTVA